MSYTILRGKDHENVHVALRHLQKTSNTKEYFRIDIYCIVDGIRVPLLVETPVLTIGTDRFTTNGREYFFLSLVNIEYDKTIQEFYRLLETIESTIMKKLNDIYPCQKGEQKIDSFEPIRFVVEYCSDVVRVFDRFKNKIENTDPIKKHSRAQFILELPSIWFELDKKKEVCKTGLHWSVLQIKDIQITPIETCLFVDERTKPIIKNESMPPNPFMSIKQIGMGDLLGGIGRLKKVEPLEKQKEVKKPSRPPMGGFQPPSLEDILSKLKSLKKAESSTS